MDKNKFNDIVNALTGLKAHEWTKIKIAVQHLFDQKYALLEIDDKEKLRTNLKLEFGAPDEG